MDKESAGRSAQMIVNYTGLLATFAFGFFAWLSVTGTGISLALLFLAFMLCRAAWPVWRRDPLMRLFVAFAAYVCLSAYLAAAELPQSRQMQIQDALDWLKLFAFLPIAWWLKGDLKRINLILVLAVLGLMIGMLRHVDWHNLVHMKVPERTGFQLKIIFSGLISGTVILALLVFAPRIWAVGRSAVLRVTFIVLWVAGLYLAAYMLLAGLSRGAWLAAVSVISITLFIRYALPNRTAKTPLGKTIPVALLALMVVGGVAGLNLEKILSRLQAENDVAASLMQGETEQLPPTSLGFRFNVQRFGLHKWLERPVFGWGTGSTVYLIAHSGKAQLLHPSFKGGVAWMDQLHNTYLEILVRFGVVGAALLIMGALLLIRAVFRAYAAGLMPRDYTLFLVGSFGLVAIWSLFDFRALHADWRAYWVCLAGIAYTFQLHALPDSPPRPRPA
jgi:O-antigen ligase